MDQATVIHAARHAAALAAMLSALAVLPGCAVCVTQPASKARAAPRAARDATPRANRKSVV